MDIDEERKKCKLKCKSLFYEIFKGKSIEEIMYLSLIIEEELGVSMKNHIALNNKRI